MSFTIITQLCVFRSFCGFEYYNNGIIINSIVYQINTIHWIEAYKMSQPPSTTATELEHQYGPHVRCPHISRILQFLQMNVHVMEMDH